MLILFLRAVLLYAFILFILRMTGKRQIADLQPFDLIITLAIADLASTAIADTNIPLLYSIVPILALYLVQQTVARLSLRFRRFRRSRVSAYVYRNSMCGKQKNRIISVILPSDAASLPAGQFAPLPGLPASAPSPPWGKCRYRCG